VRPTELLYIEHGQVDRLRRTDDEAIRTNVEMSASMTDCDALMLQNDSVKALSTVANV